MSKLIYTKNHRRNLIKYWKQFYPDYTIPIGYHVHHIKPKCTFEDQNDPRIHHPSNLIALHPDDHLTIHKCRGDKYIKEHFIMNIAGRKFTLEDKLKMSIAKKGCKLSQEHKDNIASAIKGKKHSASAISNMQKAQVKSNDTKLKLSKAHKGKSKSKEHSENISKAKKGSTWKLVNGKRVWSFKKP